MFLANQTWHVQKCVKELKRFFVGLHLHGITGALDIISPLFLVVWSLNAVLPCVTSSNECNCVCTGVTQLWKSEASTLLPFNIRLEGGGGYRRSGNTLEI